MRECRFGVVGLGMMGKEFASAASRWVHLQEDIPAPKIVGVSSATEKIAGMVQKVGSGHQGVYHGVSPAACQRGN